MKKPLDLNLSAFTSLLSLLVLSVFIISSSVLAQSVDGQGSEVDPAPTNLCPSGVSPVLVQTASCPVKCDVKSETCLICPTCGDDCLQPGEECDGDAVNSAGQPLLKEGESCSSSCQIIKCGDKIVNQGSEECDGPSFRDASIPAGTLCDDSCQVGPYCGDSVVNGDEQCDGSADCNENCEFSRCGDGIYDPAVDGTCEAGAQLGDPFYAQNCREEGGAPCTYCGDGIVQSAANEVCDGTTMRPGAPSGVVCADNCLSLTPHCGDNIINLPDEECDGTDLGQFDQIPGAACDQCKLTPFCGDGEVNNDEACDYNDPASADKCNKYCRLANPCAGVAAPDSDGQIYVKYNSFAGEDAKLYEEVQFGEDLAAVPEGTPLRDLRTKVCLPGYYDFLPPEDGGGLFEPAEMSPDWGVAGHNPDVVDPSGKQTSASNSDFLDLENDHPRKILQNFADRLITAGLLTKGTCTDPIYGNCEGLNNNFYIEFRDDLNRRDFNAEYYEDEKSKEICYTCAWIRIVGCFSSDTMITLASGEERVISELASGDLVLNPVTGNAHEVEFVMESTEESDLVKIITSSGKELKLTANHPVATISGVISAEALTVEHILLVAKGYESISTVQTQPAIAGQTVLNLMLKTDSINLDDHMVLANGVVAGDQYVQEVLSAVN